MSKKNVIAFAIVAVVIAVFVYVALWVNAVTWSPLPGSTKVAVIVVYIAVITLITMGVIGLMEADNEANPTDKTKLTVHYLKLTGSLFLLFGGLSLLILVFVPLSFHASVQGIVPLYGMKPYKTPLIKVLDKNVEVEVETADPSDPTKTIKVKKMILIDTLEQITIDPTSLPVDAVSSDPLPGDLHITIVVDREDAVKDGFLVPKNRVAGQGEIWFQDKTDPKTGTKGALQSWVAPF